MTELEGIKQWYRNQSTNAVRWMYLTAQQGTIRYTSKAAAQVRYMAGAELRARTTECPWNRDCYGEGSMCYYHDAW